MNRRTFTRCALGVAVAHPLLAGLGSKDAQYVGGTVAAIPEKAEGKLELGESEAKFSWGKGQSVSIPYKLIESIEYGQKAGRRVGMAIAVSPVALFSKKRKHFLTVSYVDASGNKQGAVFELGKDIVRTSLVTLETRSGKKVEYESEEAKKNVGG